MLLWQMKNACWRSKSTPPPKMPVINPCIIPIKNAIWSFGSSLSFDGSIPSSVKFLRKSKGGFCK